MMERRYRITARSHRLQLKDDPWPHPEHIAAFHDEIQRLWAEGFRNLFEITVSGNPLTR